MHIYIRQQNRLRPITARQTQKSILQQSIIIYYYHVYTQCTIIVDTADTYRRRAALRQTHRITSLLTYTHTTNAITISTITDLITVTKTIVVKSIPQQPTTRARASYIIVQSMSASLPGFLFRFKCHVNFSRVLYYSHKVNLW